VVGLGGALLAAEAGTGNRPETESVSEDILPLRGEPENRTGLELVGPEAEQHVRFEPEGLRIALPAGFDGVGQKTGLSCAVAVRGDFQITVNYEILQEPEQGDAGKKSGAINLLLVLDRPQRCTAALARRLGANDRAQFMGWTYLWDNDLGRHQSKSHTAPASTRSGRLRLARSGSTLLCSAAEGPGGSFAPLPELTLGEEAVKEVWLIAVSNSAGGAIDVRFSDLHVRQGASTSPAPAAAAGGWWWTGAALLGLLLAAVLGPGLYFVVRRRARPARGGTPARDDPPAPGAAAAVHSFPCAACGKTLRVRATLAGKKVRCRGCGEVVLVPGSDPGAAPAAAITDKSRPA
jgi:hypothetical protein